MDVPLNAGEYTEFERATLEIGYNPLAPYVAVCTAVKIARPTDKATSWTQRKRSAALFLVDEFQFTQPPGYTAAP